ncbi:hypothetical protein AVEN_157452-1 [Araneus ventricosus]|uniref:Uncharacterized protein n=1 Tax=Araneus ventricosus TaxID=182803 RepID=A0A4Y2PSA1_ARAVE|nr:hypothetical protein AVEN_157452-1 [Araneus ventricosus]
MNFNSNWSKPNQSYEQTLAKNTHNNNNNTATSHFDVNTQMAPPDLNVESAASEINGVENMKNVLIIIKEFAELLKACPYLITIAKKLQSAADTDVKIATFLEELTKIK